MEVAIISLITLTIALLQALRAAYNRNYADKSEHLTNRLEAETKILELETQINGMEVTNQAILSELDTFKMYKIKFESLSKAVVSKTPKHILPVIKEEYQQNIRKLSKMVKIL